MPWRWILAYVVATFFAFPQPIGDSFVLGQGVEADQRLGVFLERVGGPEVLMPVDYRLQGSMQHRHIQRAPKDHHRLGQVGAIARRQHREERHLNL